MTTQPFDGIDRLSALEQENALIKSRLQTCEQSYALLQAELFQLQQQQEMPRFSSPALGNPNWTISSDVCKRSLDLLATDPDLNNFVGHVLTAIAQQFQSPLTEYWSHDEHTAYVELIYWQGQILDRAAIATVFPCHAGLEGFRVPLGLIEEVPLSQRKKTIVFENHGTNPFTKDLQWVTHELIPQGLPKEINVPLFWGDTTMGALTIHVHQDHQFTPEQVVLAQSLAHQVTLAVQLQRLAAEAQQVAVARTRERAAQERLLEMTKANQSLQRSLEHLTRDANLDGFLGHVLMEITQRINAESGHIFLYDASTHTLRFHIRAEQGQIGHTPLPTEPEIFQAPFDADITPAFRHMCQRRTMISLNEDEFNGMAWPGTVEWFRRDGVTEAYCLALMAGDQPVGLLGMRFLTERQLSPNIDGLVHALSYQATLAIQLTTLAEEAKQTALAREREKAAQERAAELERVNASLQHSLNRLASDRNFHGFFEHLLQEIIHFLGGKAAQLFLYNAQTQTLAPSLGIDERGFTCPTAAMLKGLPVEEGFPADLTVAWQRICALGKPAYYDIDRDPEFFWPDTAEWHRSRGEQGVITTALLLGEQPLGLLGLTVTRRTEFTEAEFALFQALAHQATLAIHLACLAEENKQAIVAREQEKKAAQDRAEELAVVNQALTQRDRLLSVVAEVTQDLLESLDVEQAIQQALRKLGMAAGADRVNVLDEILDVSVGKRRHRTLMEWTTPGTPPQLEDPVTHFVTNDDVAAIIAELHAGRAVCLPLEEYPIAFQPLMAHIGIKVSGIAPIFIDGDYFGCLCLDKCVDQHLWSEQEMDVLTTAAGAIGATLLRQRLAERLMQSRAEQQRAAELAKANDALKRSLNAIAIVSDPYQIIAHILKIVAEQFDTPLVEYWLHSENFHIARVSLSCWQGEILTAAEQPDHPGNADFPSLRYLSQHDAFAHSTYFLIDDIRVDPYTRIAAAQIGIDIVAWFQRRGVTRLLNIPLWLNEQTIGSLDIWFPSDRLFTQSQIELAYTFGQQITLTSYLNRLFEETQQTVLFEERNRIASDIHDTLAQAFTGISLQLEVAKPLIYQEPGIVEQILHHISQLAKDGLDEARRSVWALYPPGMEYANLAQMLYNSVEQMSRNTSISLEVNIVGDPCSLSPYLGMNLLRIGQEALTNALKHSQAQTVWIELTYTTDSVSLLIRDDGRGFVPPTHPDSLNGGFGLLGMYERCDRIGAHLTILSQIGCGTEISVESPFS